MPRIAVVPVREPKRDRRRDKCDRRGDAAGEDKREQQLALTDEGREVAALIDEANRRYFATAFANFEQTEKAALKALLDMMMSNLNVDFRV